MNVDILKHINTDKVFHGICITTFEGVDLTNFNNHFNILISHWEEIKQNAYNRYIDQINQEITPIDFGNQKIFNGKEFEPVILSEEEKIKRQKENIEYQNIHKKYCKVIVDSSDGTLSDVWQPDRIMYYNDGDIIGFFIYLKNSNNEDDMFTLDITVKIDKESNTLIFLNPTFIHPEKLNCILKR